MSYPRWHSWLLRSQKSLVTRIWLPLWINCYQLTKYGNDSFWQHSYVQLNEWILLICEPFWNNSQANLSDSWTILKWFWSESLNLGVSWTILNQFSSKSQWFGSHSEMILEWISVNLGDSWPFWNDSLMNLGDCRTIHRSYMVRKRKG